MRIQQKPIIHGRDHLPGGPDPIPGMPNPFGDTLAALILGKDPVGFWKLNELSGTTAHDSTQNGNDMEPGGGYNPPDWGQLASPPGDTTAKWPDTGISGPDSYREAVTLVPYTDDFTAGIWAYAINNARFQSRDLFGQGKAVHSSGDGWGINFQSGSPISVVARSGGTTDSIVANGNASNGVWYFIATVRDSGTWKLYLDGLLQADTMTRSPGATAADTWIGSSAFGSIQFTIDMLLSYAFIVDRVLSGAELLEMYETGTLGGAVAPDQVWTAQGDGTADWAPARIEVEF